jgi:hypothetical protein
VVKNENGGVDQRTTYRMLPAHRFSVGSSTHVLQKVGVRLVPVQCRFSAGAASLVGFMQANPINVSSLEDSCGLGSADDTDGVTRI